MINLVGRGRLDNASQGQRVRDIALDEVNERMVPHEVGAAGIVLPSNQPDDLISLGMKEISEMAAISP